MCVSAIIQMADVNEQKICIKCCFKLKKPAVETLRMIKEAFGDQALSQARTFVWFKRFKNGRESVKDRKHSGKLRRTISFAVRPFHKEENLPLSSPGYLIRGPLTPVTIINTFASIRMCLVCILIEIIP